MQPSDRQVPFNYLVIQSPEGTSVGKSSTFPWRDRKEDFTHYNVFSPFSTDGFINLPFLL